MEKQQKILSVGVYYMHIPTQTLLDILKKHMWSTMISIAVLDLN